MMRRAVAAGVFAAVLSTLPGPGETRGQGSYHDTEHGWGVAIPAGWMQWPEEAVAAANAEAARAAPGKNFRYIAGFRREESDENGFPFVLVQVVDRSLEGATYADIEKLVGAGEVMDQAAAEAMKTGLVSGVQFDRPRLDRASNRIYIPATMTLPDGTPGRSLSVAFLRNSGILQVNCYDNVADFAGHAPEFDAIVASVRLDPGQEFVPAKVSRVWSGVIRGGLIGGVVGLVMGGMQWLKRRRKAAA